MSKIHKFCNFSKTDHVETRLRQRGFPSDAFDILTEMADTESTVGGGSVSLSLSRRGLEDLDPEQRRTKAAEKAIKSALVVQGTTVITATNLDNKGSEKHYRADIRKDGHPHRPRSRRGSERRFDR